MSLSTSGPDLPVIHFLHIGKTAGTQIRNIAQQLNDSQKYHVNARSHHVTLSQIPEEEAYFFSIRRPFERFFSAFYSRKRQGRPRYHAPWTKHEALAFSRFPHANDLAEALFADGAQGREALAAMTSIRHLSSPHLDWFREMGSFLEIRPPIAIIRQEKFTDDLKRFLRTIGCTFPIKISVDPRITHENDYKEIPTLSEKSLRNLATWYASDLEFYKSCENWLEERSHRTTPSINIP